MEKRRGDEINKQDRGTTRACRSIFRVRVRGRDAEMSVDGSYLSSFEQASKLLIATYHDGEFVRGYREGTCISQSPYFAFPRERRV